MPAAETPLAEKRASTTSLVALIIGTVSYFTLSGVSFTVLPRLVTEVLGGEESELGLAFGAFSLGLLLIRPFVGWLVDRFGRRKVIFVGAAAASLSQLLYLPAAELGLWPLLGARLLTGLGGSPMYVAFATVATELPGPARRAQVFSIFSAATFIGFAIGPFVGEVAYAASGIGLAYGVAALIGLIPTLSPLLMPETTPADVEPKFGSLRTMLHPVGIRLGPAAMIVIIAFLAFNSFATTWTLALGGNSGRWVILTFSVSALLLRLGAGKLLDGNRRRIATFGYVGVAVGCLFAASATSPLMLYVTAVVLAGGLAWLTPLLVLVGADASPDVDRARVLGTITFFNDLGASLAVPILGAIAEFVGFRAMYTVVAAMAVVALAYFRTPVIERLIDARVKPPA